MFYAALFTLFSLVSLFTFLFLFFSLLRILSPIFFSILFHCYFSSSFLTVQFLLYLLMPHSLSIFSVLYTIQSFYIPELTNSWNRIITVLCQGFFPKRRNWITIQFFSFPLHFESLTTGIRNDCPVDCQLLRYALQAL